MFDAGVSVRQVTVAWVVTAVFSIRRTGYTERISTCSVDDDDYVTATWTGARVVV